MAYDASCRHLLLQILMMEASGIDKATALEALAAELCIPQSNVFAFGNDYNDLGTRGHIQY